VIRRKQSEDELKRYREYLEEVVEIRTAELQKEIERRKQAEEALLAEHESLAQKVAERTTELQKANKELARAARLKDEFLANMSHELRTPLHIILGLSEALQEQVYGDLNEKQLSIVSTIEEKGHQLLELITDLLDLSRIVTRNLELDLTPVSVGAVGQASIDSIYPLAQKKHIHTSYTLESAVTSIQADERRLKQILINLLNNAVKFTPEGGAIGLNVKEDNNHQRVYFKVWDTGIGITKEDMEQLFTQPLVQLDGKLSRRYPGIGLGLSLTYHIVKMHGGTISLESEIGKGSCFTVAFPKEPMCKQLE
jgi:signal transduction histidine kinase